MSVILIINQYNQQLAVIFSQLLQWKITTTEILPWVTLTTLLDSIICILFLASMMVQQRLSTSTSTRYLIMYMYIHIFNLDSQLMCYHITECRSLVYLHHSERKFRHYIYRTNQPSAASANKWVYCWRVKSFLSWKLNWRCSWAKHLNYYVG